MLKQENKTDVIVVGAGPAGISCAITLARSGKEVVLIERGLFAGSKNVFGGAIYTQPTKEIFPNFEQEAPVERCTVKHNFAILGEVDSTTISYRKNDNTSYSVIRGKFDRWAAEEARKAGVYLVEETVVRELIKQKNKVIGVKTELEDFYADIVILADGVNSLLAKQVGLRKTIETKDVALSVKEVIKLDKDVINQRFNVKDNEGVITEIFGGSMLGVLGLGFMYTNKESVTIGLGITLNELVDSTQYVADNGKLVYCVPTFDIKETMLIVHKFLEIKKDFKLVKENTYFPFEKDNSVFYYAIFEKKEN